MLFEQTGQGGTTWKAAKPSFKGRIHARPCFSRSLGNRTGFHSWPLPRSFVECSSPFEDFALVKRWLS
jgi:hypothetical protein